MKDKPFSKFNSVFFQLIVFGHWQYVEGNNNYFILYHPDTKLFDMETEKWKDIPSNDLTVKRNGTYKSKESVSLFDLEVLESNGFKKSK